MFYDWEELRDLARPGALTQSELLSGQAYGYEHTGRASLRGGEKTAARRGNRFCVSLFRLAGRCGHACGC